MTKPPKNIPDDLLSAFTQDGSIPVRYSYRDDTSAGEPRTYLFDEWIDCLHRAEAQNPWYYPMADKGLFSALRKYPMAGKSVVVFGSCRPWYEAICVEAGAAKVTVLEYARIEHDYNVVEYRGAGEFEDGEFDMAVSISSFEHDGLGRYGDPIDPRGDLRAMDTARRCLKKGGLLFLSVPVGLDYVVWNLHRVYGHKRLPMLLEGWNTVKAYQYWPDRLEARDDQYHPLFVLEPK